MKRLLIVYVCWYLLVVCCGASAANASCSGPDFRVSSDIQSGGGNFAYLLSGTFYTEFRASKNESYEPVSITWRVRKTTGIEDTFPNDNEETDHVIYGVLSGGFYIGIAAGGVYTYNGKPYQDAKLKSIGAMQELLNALLQQLIVLP